MACVADASLSSVSERQFLTNAGSQRHRTAPGLDVDLSASVPACSRTLRDVSDGSYKANSFIDDSLYSLSLRIA